MGTATPRRLGVAVLVAASVITAAGLAWAQTTTTVPPDPPPPGRLADLKATADRDVKMRLTQLTNLAAAVKGAGGDCGQNSTLLGQLNAAGPSLQQLDATIQAETGLARAVAEFRQIFVDYRVYLLQTPKAYQAVGCAKLAKVNATLGSLAQQIQARVNQAKANGRDVTGAQAALNDLASQLGAAATSANQASSAVVPLQPDQGNGAVLASNLATLAAGRSGLHAALADLHAARRDAATAIDDLRALR
ncbi:MAG: hypothetical protein JO265_15315 [Acidimicrobiia bacterium]|nr:hypothetical protein [Acidimicrobiia bacterium]